MTDTWLSDRKIKANSHCALSKHNLFFLISLQNLLTHWDQHPEKKEEKDVWAFNLLANICNFHTSGLSNWP